jgi:acetyl-CoA acetyltransferase
MTTAIHPAHVPYEDASSPADLHGDCAEAKRNIKVPLPRRAVEVATTVAGAAPARVKAPVLAVSDRLARMGASFFDRPS